MMTDDERNHDERNAAPPTGDDEACLREMLVTALLRHGLAADSIPSLLESIEQPNPSVTDAKPWRWLDSQEARQQVACLVLLVRHGAAYLTTFECAKRWFGKPAAIVIDVSSFIRAIETRTGLPFEMRPRFH